MRDVHKIQHNYNVPKMDSFCFILTLSTVLYRFAT